jgi:hypothetical protein
VSSIPTHCGVYSIQYYMINFVSELRVWWFPPVSGYELYVVQNIIYMCSFTQNMKMSSQKQTILPCVCVKLKWKLDCSIPNSFKTSIVSPFVNWYFDVSRHGELLWGKNQEYCIFMFFRGKFILFQHGTSLPDHVTLINKRSRIPNRQSKMDSPEKLAICVGHRYAQTNTN